MTTYCYPYKRATGWRSQGFRSGKGSPFNPPEGHTGFDQAMDEGTPIFAPGDGIIRNSGWLSDNYLANDWWLTAMGGDTLVIDCFGPDGTTASGPTFIIAHLKDSTAPVGARVKKGQQIGISGNSGTATTGAHAHIEALPPNWDWNNGVYGRVDPESYFTEWPEDIHTRQGFGGAAIAPQGTTTTADWTDMFKDIKEFKETVAESMWAVLEGPRAKKAIQKIIWGFDGGKRNGKQATVWRDLVDSNTLGRQLLVEVETLKEVARQQAANPGQAVDYDEIQKRVSAAFEASVESVVQKQEVTTTEINLKEGA